VGRGIRFQPIVERHRCLAPFDDRAEYWGRERIGRSRMGARTGQEFQFGRFEIRLAAAQVDLPGVEGWVGTWSIYRLPVDRGEIPLRYGDTDLQESEDMAIGMARTVASLVARSL
jgi:hypothetical protein